MDDMRGRQHTEDEFLGGRQHVYGECDLVLVNLQAKPSNDGGNDGEHHCGKGGLDRLLFLAKVIAATID